MTEAPGNIATCSGSAASCFLLAHHYYNVLYELLWGDITGCVKQSQKKKKRNNPKPIWRCCKVISSLLSAYKLIFSLQSWVHIWNGDGFSSKSCSVTFQTHFCESTHRFQSEFRSVMPCLYTFCQILSPCYALWKVLSNGFLPTCTKPLLNSYARTVITWPTSPFSVWEPCSACLEGFFTSKISPLTLLFFLAMDIGYVRCGHALVLLTALNSLLSGLLLCSQ